MSNRNFHDGKREHAEALSNSHRAAEYDSIDVTPVNAVIGAAVTGVDMTRELPTAQVEDLKALHRTTGQELEKAEALLASTSPPEKPRRSACRSS